MESIGYTFVFILSGEYNWWGLSDSVKSKEDSHWILAEEKDLQNLKSGLLKDLEDDIREVVIEYFEYCRCMEFDEKPDYRYMKWLFKGLYEWGAWETKIDIPLNLK